MVGIVALLLVSPAEAQDLGEVAITASTSYDSNPFLGRGSDTDVASFRLELAPSISRSNGVTTIRVSGRAEHIEYLRRYDSAQNVSANVAATHRFSERLDGTANLSLSSTVSTTDFVGPVAGGDEPGPGELPPVIDDDITLLGDRQRRNQAALSGGLRYRLSDSDEIRWSGSIQASRYNSARLQDSDYASQRIAYSHRVNGGLIVGGGVDLGLSNFKDGRLGDARTISPQLAISAALSPRIQASANLGLAHTRTKLAAGTVSSTAFAGNATLCYKGTYSNFCINGLRQTLPSAIGGVRNQSTVGATYSLRLSERDTVQLGGSYSTASAPLAGMGGNLDSVRGYGRYERILNERTRLFASMGYSDTSDDLGVRRSNFQGAIGITFKFGKTR